MSGARTGWNIPAPGDRSVPFVCFLVWMTAAEAMTTVRWPSAWLSYVAPVAMGTMSMSAFTHGWFLRRRLARAWSSAGFRWPTVAFALGISGLTAPHVRPWALGLVGLVGGFGLSHRMGPWWDGEEGTAEIVLPPGVHSRSVLGWLLSKRTFDLVIEPVIADMQAEWLEAIVAAQTWRARWIHARGLLTLAQHVLAQAPISLARAVYEAWRASK